jgi:hypothetical protein
MTMALATKDLKDMPKNHDEKTVKAQAGVVSDDMDKIGSVEKDSATSKIIQETAAPRAKAGDTPLPGGVEGTGHSTLHVTGAPQIAEKAQKGAGVKIGDMVTYWESDYEVSGPGGGSNPEGTNGTREHPALVTRVWSKDCVNLRVFRDMNHELTRAGVMKRGVSYDQVPDGVQTSGGNACWY